MASKERFKSLRIRWVLISTITLVAVGAISFFLGESSSEIKTVDGEQHLALKHKTGKTIQVLQDSNRIIESVNDDIHTTVSVEDNQNLAHEKIEQVFKPVPVPQFIKDSTGLNEPILDSKSEKSDEERREDDIWNQPALAAKNGDWDVFLDTAPGLLELSQRSLNSSIRMAVLYQAPLYVFKQLLDLGAQFQPVDLFILARENKLNLIRQLIPLGLDIHMQTRKGDNAITAILFNFAARDTFKFLLYNGVEITQGTMEYDPLMTALKGAEKKHEAVFYAYQLMRFGETPTAAHREQARKLQVINPKSYGLIQKNISELL